MYRSVSRNFYVYLSVIPFEYFCAFTLRLLPKPLPSAECFSYPRCSVISAPRAASIIALRRVLVRLTSSSSVFTPLVFNNIKQPVCYSLTPKL